MLAYTFGLRHAFDAVHIAAVDNPTRKLLADGYRQPLSVGFWFSLGHSTIVFGLAFLLSVGVKALAGRVGDDGSELHSFTGVAHQVGDQAMAHLPDRCAVRLGFDTATEVGLLVLAGGAAAFNWPFYAILVLPARRSQGSTLRSASGGSSAR